jgi:DNA-binding CsgD family transcriptional regulator
MQPAVAVIPPEEQRSPGQIAAAVIPAIGRPDFPERLLGVYRELAGCDFCSVFSWESQDGPRLLFALGMHPEIPGFVLSAARAYANTYWRFDTNARQGMMRACGGVSLLRITPADIRDPDYRHYCYQRAGICERLMLVDTAAPTLSVSGYRTVSRGPAPPLVIQRMQEVAPMLIAAIRRHHELIEQEAQATGSPSSHILVNRAHEWGLSAREAEVAAGLAMGRRQVEIAKRAGITLNSVITYRRRAYQKLRVSDRLELRALCERLAAGSGPEAMEDATQ